MNSDPQTVRALQYLQRPKLGFLLGKFMPPHNGHVFLCEFARQYVDRLIILVGSLPTEPIPGELRFKWMKELFPDCDVVWTNEILPQEPTGPDDEEFWKIWKRVCNDAMRSAQGDNWTTPDVVFASEDYGHRLAKELNAEFVPVDMTRTAVPSSGTMMRSEPPSASIFCTRSGPKLGVSLNQRWTCADNPARKVDCRTCT